MMTCTRLKPPEKFDFPFTPYQIQDDFMRRLYEVIEDKGLGIFESPTGTGKSLSIICGALRWLKDHNMSLRDNLARQIHDLEEEKSQLGEEADDWLANQSRQLEISRKLHELSMEQKRILDYDGKIEILKRKKNGIEKTGQRQFQSKESVCNEVKTDVGESDDYFLEDPSTESDDSSDEDVTEKFHSVKVFICSRTHSQLSQLVDEIRKSPYGKDVRVVSLASRQNYCINTDVIRLKHPSLINERCLEMQKNKKPTAKDTEGKVLKRKRGSVCNCPYNKQQNVDDMKHVILTEVQDIEEIVTSGKELKACPYYASRKAVENAEVVLVPYNTVLHKETREANGINLKEAVLIIDEAHNLLEALTQMYSANVTYQQLRYCHLQLQNYKAKYNLRFSSSNLLSINQLLFVIGKLKMMLERRPDETIDVQMKIFTVGNFVFTADIDNYNMFKLVQFCKDAKLAQKMQGFAKAFSQEDRVCLEQTKKKGVKQFLIDIVSEKNKLPEVNVQKITEHNDESAGSINSLPSVISFIKALTYSYEDGRVLVQKSQNDDECKLQFLLLNPAEKFRTVLEDARAVIVAGGTMKPVTDFRKRLFINAGADNNRIVEFCCDHIISAENILPIIVTTGLKKEPLLFNYNNRSSMRENVKDILLEVCGRIRGGIVAFFSSYKYENSIWEQVKDVNFGRQIFREPHDSSGVDGVLESYAKAVRRLNSNGALLLSVVGGKLSEGLNFSDDLGRCVMVFGLPYGNARAADLKEKMKYLEETEELGAGQKFYEGSCMKAVNQCIGRAVRHKDDYATVLLLDERYNRAATKNMLPEWIKRHVRATNFRESCTQIDEFFGKKFVNPPTLVKKDL